MTARVVVHILAVSITLTLSLFCGAQIKTFVVLAVAASVGTEGVVITANMKVLPLPQVNSPGQQAAYPDTY